MVKRDGKILDVAPGDRPKLDAMTPDWSLYSIVAPTPENGFPGVRVYHAIVVIPGPETDDSPAEYRVPTN